MARRNSLPLATIIAAQLWRLVRGNPKLLLVVFALGGGWYAYEALYARPQMAYMGTPQAEQWLNPYSWNRTLRNDGFMVGYSDLRSNPLWVSYRLSPISGHTSLKRPGHFSSDWRSLTRIDHKDYTSSGYDRGHMAPNYAISQLYGKAAQRETFLMTNITPQKPNLNRKLWQRLEAVAVDHFARQKQTVWVLTGPIFDGDQQRLKSNRLVEIPDAFYKIFVTPAGSEGESPKVLAFIMPQNARGNESLMNFLVTVDEVEKRTGLDFFSQLNDSVERLVESSVEPAAWQLKKVARLPSRY